MHLPDRQYRSLIKSERNLKSDFNITRVITSKSFLKRIASKKIDLGKVSETDIRACVKPRTLFKGDVLDLRYLQRVKRGPIQVLSSIFGGWLRLRFPRSARLKYDYAFMVHPRTYADVLRGVPFLKYIPEKWSRAFVKKLPPFRLSDMTGLTNIEGKPMTGALMCIGWDREMFEQDPRGREQKIADLVKLAKHMGIKYVGFAALLPWASRYGQCLEGTIAKAEVEKMFQNTNISWDDLKVFFTNPDERNLIPKPIAEIKDQIKALITNKAKRKQFMVLLKWAARVGGELQDITITTGHPFTIALIAGHINKLIKLHPKKDPLIAIVGAAGSTGSCCCRKIAEDGANNLLLVDRVKSTGVTNLDQLSSEIQSINPQAKVSTTTNLKDLIQADIIIVVSSAKGTIIDSEFLRPGAIVVDDSQPRNVDPKIAQQRKDVRIITVLAPLDGLIPNFYFDKHTPFTNACFTCAGDVSLRTRTHTAVSATGPATMEAIKVVEQMSAKARRESGFDPFEPVFYTYNRGVISDDDIKAIAALTLAPMVVKTED